MRQPRGNFHPRAPPVNPLQGLLPDITSVQPRQLEHGCLQPGLSPCCLTSSRGEHNYNIKNNSILNNKHMNILCEGSLYKGSWRMHGWLERWLHHNLMPIDSLGAQSSPDRLPHTYRGLVRQSLKLDILDSSKDWEDREKPMNIG